MKFHPNLYVKVSILLLSIVAIPTVLLGYLSFNQSNQQIQTITKMFLFDDLNHNAIRMKSLLSQTELQSEKVLESSKMKTLLKNMPPQSSLEEYDFIRQINPLLEEMRGGYELNVYPLNPKSYANYSGNVTGDEDWFQTALSLEGKGAWYVRSTVDGLPSELLYVRAIRDYPVLQPIGVLTLHVPRYLLDNQFVIPEQINAISYYMLEGSGRVIASRSRNSGEGELIRIDPDSEDQLSEGSPLKIIHRNGIDFYVVSKPLDSNNWRMAALIPIKEVTGPIVKIKRFTWLLVASSIGVMSILLLLLVRSVTIPIRTLVRSMRTVYKGQLVYCDDYSLRKDEIGQLVRGYNSMIKGMYELIDKMKLYEEEKRKLEIRALVHQVNPHFLYNTMDTIKWKAEKVYAPEIVSMVDSLSNLLRFSIHTDEELTTLEREMEYVKNYVSLVLQRNYDAFSVYYQIDRDILYRPFMKLTVQPLVENAIKHAMNVLENGEGKIMITVRGSEDRIMCIVEDNGPGISGEIPKNAAKFQETAYNPNSSGVGLLNTDRRLKLRFGGSFGITLENRESGGCKVILLHPLIDTESSSL
ncbi:histidine kinase [Paenibacillus oryzisoli]|uniref:sensor histidine kinase n=1 Tax=Paenibacillus oryzisoli TaxID=1850517 RepID=UPI003D2A74D0